MFNRILCLHSLRITHGTFWFICLSLLGMHTSILGLTIAVPADQPTIQDGIDSARTGDTVEVSPGIYSGTGNRDISYHGKGIVVLSKGGPQVTTLDAGSVRRLFRFVSGESSRAILQGFKLVAGQQTTGGAVELFNASATIVDCTFEQNSATNFESGGWGGAIYAAGAACSVLVQDCRFFNNRAGAGGGAVFVDAGAYGSFGNCEFRANRAAFGYGGAAAVWRAAAEFDFCYFTANDADSGGAIALSHGVNGSTSPSVWLSSCLLSGNSASHQGGGALDITDSSSMTVRLSTFVLNASAGSGSAARVVRNSNLWVSQSILSFGLGGPAVQGDASAFSFYCSDLFGSDGGDWTAPVANQLGINGNFSANPLFCDTSQADYQLQTVSPCASINSPCESRVGLYGVSCGCCLGKRGNVDDDSQQKINIADLTYLISYFYLSGPVPPCMGQANIDGEFGYTVSDITYLVSFMFRGGPEPPPCL